MMSPKLKMPNTRKPNRDRSAVMTIQLMLSEIAAATSRTQRATKNAMAFWRRVTPRFYATASSLGTTVVLLIDLGDSGHLDVPRQAQPSQRADPNPVQVELVPGQAMTRRHRVGVMIVVPALAKGQQRHPPVVGGVVRVVKRRDPHRCVAELTSHVV